MAHQSSLGHFVLIYRLQGFMCPFLTLIQSFYHALLSLHNQLWSFFIIVMHMYITFIVLLCLTCAWSKSNHIYLLTYIYILYIRNVHGREFFLISSSCSMSYIIYIVYAKGSKLGILQFTSRVDDSLYALNNTHIGKSFSKCSLMIIPFVIHDRQYLQEY